MADQTTTIPKGWKMTTLVEVANIQPGFAFKSQDFETKKGLPVVKIKNIQPPIVKIEQVDLVDISNYAEEKLAKFEVRNGEYLIAMTGETIGKVGKYNLGKFAYINQRVCKIVKTEKSDYGFIYYSLLQSAFQKFIDTHSFGAAQANISSDQIGYYKILLPPLSEQRAIAAVLSSLDDKIELLREQNKTLEATAQAIFKEWFVNFNFPGATGKMIDSELGKIPEGWRVGRIEDLCKKLASGGTPATSNADYYGGDIDWFSTKELQDNFIFESDKKITEAGLESSSAKVFPKGSVVMAIYAAPTVGRLGILGKDATFNQASCGFVANEEIASSEYIYLLLFSLRGDFNNLANGAAQQNLNVGLVKNFAVVIPNKTTMARFKAVIIPIFEKILNNTSQIQTLSVLRDALLPKLMRGEVRVKGFKN